MIITTEVTVSFKVPEEHDLLRKFMSDHDMSEWKDCSSTHYMSFKKVEVVGVDINVDSKEVTNND